ncbi:MAG: hypothetical protein IT521_13395 [Burkholderiales bacterium]|nr:hypothetical protein [Burkholderiales bacterium]
MNRESLVFCTIALVVALAVCAVGFQFAALPRDAIGAARQPVAVETLPDVDLGGGFGKVSVIDLVAYYMENPPEKTDAAVGHAAAAAKRFGGC